MTRPGTVASTKQDVVEQDSVRRSRRPYLVAVLVFLIFVMPSMLVFKPLGSSATPATLLGMGLFVLWCAWRAIGEPPLPARTTPAHWLLLTFAAAILMSYALMHTMADRQPLEIRGADRGLMLLIGWSGILLYCADRLRRWNDVTFVVRVLVAAGACVAVIGLLQYAFGFDLAQYLQLPGLEPRSDLGYIGDRGGLRRVAGPMSHPIEYGVCLAAVFPLALAMAMSRRRKSDWIMLGLIMLALPTSISRSTMVAIAVGALVVGASWGWRRRLIVAAATPFVLLGMRLALPGTLGTILSLFENIGVDPSISGRTEDYAAADAFITESPWFGRGFGTFTPELYRLLDNQYLGILIEAGFVGLISLVALLVTALFLARGGALRFGSASPQGQLCIGLSASVAVLTVSFATFDGLGFAAAANALFLFIGLAAAVWRISVEVHGWRAISPFYAKLIVRSARRPAERPRDRRRSP
ncbi:O-antigen ligase family protein [Actinopolymorpha pittospori]